jgi:localization factor PodJL
MASGTPWSIKGVSADARVAAREAAKRAGEPLGVWLARVIHETAEAEARERGDTADRSEAAALPEAAVMLEKD